MSPFDSDESSGKQSMKTSNYFQKENQCSLLGQTRRNEGYRREPSLCKGRAKHTPARKSGLVSQDNLPSKNPHNDIKLIRGLLGKLIESAQAERQWHVTHHNNISCIAKALNSSMEQLDSSLPKVSIIPPTFLASNERNVLYSHTGFGEANKSLWENTRMNIDPSPTIGGKQRNRPPEPELSQLISRAHRHHTLHSEKALHERLRAVSSVEHFLQLDEESFGRIFPLLCDWLFSIAEDTNSHQDPWDEIEDKESQKKNCSANCYHAFLLLYEGVRFYPDVFMEPRHDELVKNILHALRSLYDNKSWIQEVGLLPCDISSLNNHLVQIVEQCHRKTSTFT
ncbi:peter pan protein [Perkinsela sp. CCAP 1560/4]|nr:peter pan protein [Perkinsela sp. CCAP 1560/4]|eukprot:KNH04729.1 peter pan protein [Perkinsela sp. CCAP 1560/4]